MNDSANKKQPNIQYYADGTASVMRKAVVYTELRFYKRSDVLYQLTQVFCQRYLPRYGRGFGLPRVPLYARLRRRLLRTRQSKEDALHKRGAHVESA